MASFFLRSSVWRKALAWGLPETYVVVRHLSFVFTTQRKLRRTGTWQNRIRYRILEKLYPETNDEIIAVLKISERKMQYQEYDLKRARNIVDPKTGEKMTIPSREDSYERLQEMAVQFPEENRSVEDQILKKIECEQLHKFLLELSKEEQWLIQELYFEERTERDLAEELKIYHNAVHKRKNRILKKLKNILEKLRKLF